MYSQLYNSQHMKIISYTRIKWSNRWEEFQWQAKNFPALEAQQLRMLKKFDWCTALMAYFAYFPRQVKRMNSRNLKQRCHLKNFGNISMVYK